MLGGSLANGIVHCAKIRCVDHAPLFAGGKGLVQNYKIARLEDGVSDHAWAVIAVNGGSSERIVFRCLTQERAETAVRRIRAIMAAENPSFLDVPLASG